MCTSSSLIVKKEENFNKKKFFFRMHYKFEIVTLKIKLSFWFILFFIYFGYTCKLLGDIKKRRK